MWVGEGVSIENGFKDHPPVLHTGESAVRIYITCDKQGSGQPVVLPDETPKSRI